MNKLFRWSFVLIAVLTGCGQSETYLPVEGKVLVNGSPLAGNERCYVILQPDRSKGNKSPHEPKATISPQGVFKVQTVARNGTTPGWYRVRIEAAEVIDMQNPYVTKWLVPEKYADFQKSGLVIEVAPGKTYDLAITK